MTSVLDTEVPDLPLASWEDPDHPLFQEFDQQFQEAFPPRPKPAVPVEVLAGQQAIVSAMRVIAKPTAIGYEGVAKVYQLLENGGLGGACVYGGPCVEEGVRCNYETKNCPLHHRFTKGDDWEMIY